MVNLNIGQKIQRYRNQRGLSLRGLAEKTGITASMISQIENNSVNPSINTLKTLAETLDFPLYVLFQEENDPEQELIVRKGAPSATETARSPTTCLQRTPGAASNLC